MKVVFNSTLLLPILLASFSRAAPLSSASALKSEAFDVIIATTAPGGPTHGRLVQMPTDSSLRVVMEKSLDLLFLNETLILDPHLFGCSKIGGIQRTSGQKTFLVFVRCYEGDNDLFLIDGSSASKTQITAPWDKVNASSFDLSPDGKSLIYARINSCCVDKEGTETWPPQGLVLYDITSGQKRMLSDDSTDGAVPPRWSHDGRWIAYANLSPGATETDIVVMDSSGQKSRVVTHIQGRATDLAWEGSHALRVVAPTAANP